VLGVEGVFGAKGLEAVSSADPKVWMAATSELVESTRATLEFLFSMLGAHTESPLATLLMRNFDSEKIWQQIDLQATPTLKKKAVEVDEDLEEIPEIAPKAAETPTQKEVTTIVEEPAGVTTVASEAPSNEEIIAGSAPEAPKAQIADGVSPKGSPEAFDASTEEVKAPEVTSEVEEKRMGLVALLQFIQITNAGSATPEATE
jgi:hypothetical protein